MLVSGPIASGKSTLSRAVADRLRRTGTPAAAVDVDLVYELLEERGHSPGEPELWRKAHRLAGRIAAALFEEGVEVVLVEGDFLSGENDAELLASARPESVRRIVLRCSLETASARVELDDDRGISRNRNFLTGHYEQIAPLLASRRGNEFVIDTDELPVGVAAKRAAASLGGTTASARPR